MTHTEYESSNKALYAKIQDVYDRHFKPEVPYTQQFEYKNATNYGFTDFECREYAQTVEYTADDFVSHISIYAPHMTLQEPHKSEFFSGIRDAVLSFGDRIVLNNSIILYLARKA